MSGGVSGACFAVLRRRWARFLSRLLGSRSASSALGRGDGGLQGGWSGVSAGRGRCSGRAQPPVPGRIRGTFCTGVSVPGLDLQGSGGCGPARRGGHVTVPGGCWCLVRVSRTVRQPEWKPPCLWPGARVFASKSLVSKAVLASHSVITGERPSRSGNAWLHGVAQSCRAAGKRAGAGGRPAKRGRGNPWRVHSICPAEKGLRGRLRSWTRTLSLLGGVQVRSVRRLQRLPVKAEAPSV